MARQAHEIITNTLPLSGRVVLAHNNLVRDFDAALEALHTGTYSLSEAQLQGDDTDVRIVPFSLTFKGVPLLVPETIADWGAVNDTIPAEKWALYVVTLDVGAMTASVASIVGNSVGYDTEAEALADLPTPPVVGTSLPLGYVTVQASEGDDWIAGTDGFAGESSGNPADATNFYVYAMPTWREVMDAVATTSAFIYG